MILFIAYTQASGTPHIGASEVISEQLSDLFLKKWLRPPYKDSKKEIKASFAKICQHDTQVVRTGLVMFIENAKMASKIDSRPMEYAVKYSLFMFNRFYFSVPETLKKGSYSFYSPTIDMKDNVEIWPWCRVQSKFELSEETPDSVGRVVFMPLKEFDDFAARYGRRKIVGDWLP